MKNFENSGLILDLENKFNTDILVNNQVDTVTFLHKKYGSLSKYVKPSPAESVVSKILELKTEIKSAIKKTEKVSLDK